MRRRGDGQGAEEGPEGGPTLIKGGRSGREPRKQERNKEEKEGRGMHLDLDLGLVCNRGLGLQRTSRSRRKGKRSESKCWITLAAKTLETL